MTEHGLNVGPLVPVMLLLWFPVTLALFMRLRSAAMAASISIVGTGLLLPSGYAFDFTGLPPIGRETVAVLASLLAVLYSKRKLLSERKPLQGGEFLALIMIFGAFATVLTNGEPRNIGPRMLPALRLWDVADMSADAVFSYGIPYYLGRVLFRNPRDLQIILMVLVVAGLSYSLPILWEVRMSPGIHHFLYGYHPAGFVQAHRELFYGWRPMVLVGHGLALSMFVLTTSLAASGLRRAMPARDSFRFSMAAGYLGIIVVLCNSVGTIVYAMGTVPLLALGSKPVLRRVLMAATLLVVLYPALRASDIFPSTGLVDLAASYSQDRADSLKYRFDNEDMLLTQAREKLMFGWGGYGRGRVYDLMRGEDISTTDGYWIIVLGVQGLIGFLAIFGMMLLPVVGAIRATARRSASPEVYLVLGTALIVAISAIDLLPNGAPTIRTVFCAGALAGSLRGWRAGGRKRSPRRGGKASPVSRPRSGEGPGPEREKSEDRSDGSQGESGSLGAGLL